MTTLSEQVAALEAELKIANESSAAWRKHANQEEQRAIAAESQLAAAQKQTRIEITARDHYRDERDAAIARAEAAEKLAMDYANAAQTINALNGQLDDAHAAIKEAVAKAVAAEKREKLTDECATSWRMQFVNQHNLREAAEDLARKAERKLTERYAVAHNENERKLGAVDEHGSSWAKRAVEAEAVGNELRNIVAAFVAGSVGK